MAPRGRRGERSRAKGVGVDLDADADDRCCGDGQLELVDFAGSCCSVDGGGRDEATLYFSLLRLQVPEEDRDATHFAWKREKAHTKKVAFDSHFFFSEHRIDEL